MTLLSRLSAHMIDNQAPVALHAERSMGELEFAAASEWGREAPDSPMAGAGAYGIGDTLEAAIEMMLTQAGHDAGVEPDDLVLVSRAELYQALGQLALPHQEWAGAEQDTADCAAIAIRIVAVVEPLLRDVEGAGKGELEDA